MTRLDGIINSVDMSFSKLKETVKDRKARRAAVCGVAKSQHNWETEQQQYSKQLEVQKNLFTDAALPPGQGLAQLVKKKK